MLSGFIVCTPLHGNIRRSHLTRETQFPFIWVEVNSCSPWVPREENDKSVWSAESQVSWKWLLAFVSFKLEVRMRLKLALDHEVLTFETTVGRFCGRAVPITDLEKQGQTGAPLHPAELPCTQAGEKSPQHHAAWRLTELLCMSIQFVMKPVPCHHSYQEWPSLDWF